MSVPRPPFRLPMSRPPSSVWRWTAVSRRPADVFTAVDTNDAVRGARFGGPRSADVSTRAQKNGITLPSKAIPDMECGPHHLRGDDESSGSDKGRPT
jgi:hypothetical protein